MAHSSRTRGMLDLGLDTSGGTGFVRERLALLGKTLFLVSFGFWLFLLASMVLGAKAPLVPVLRSPVALGHVCASSVMSAVWLLTRRGTLSLAALGAVDAVALALAGGFLAFMTANDSHQVLQALL